MQLFLNKKIYLKFAKLKMDLSVFRGFLRIAQKYYVIYKNITLLLTILRFWYILYIMEAMYMYYSEITKIIESGLERDKEKVKNYSIK